MGTQRIGWIGALVRGVPALAVVALVSGAFTGPGPANAAAREGGMRPATADRTAATRVISTVAGGVGGPGKATAVALPGPCGASFAGGALYIADAGAVQQVSPATDQLTTLAGTGAAGPPANGGPATSASVGTCAATADAAGNLVIADGLTNGLGGVNDQVRVVAKISGTFYGQVMTAGDIYAVAGNGTAGFSGDGGPATSAGLNNPSAVTVDAAGNLLIADSGDQRIRMVTG